MESLTTFDNKIRIVAVGDGLVGKSCAITKLISHHAASKQPSYLHHDNQLSLIVLMDKSISMEP